MLMSDESPLSRSEFLTHVGYLRDDVHAVHARLDVLNGRTRTAEQSIAVLHDRANDSKASGAKWGGAAGAFLGAVLTALWHFLGGGAK